MAIVALVSDLIFESKITATARAAGIAVEVVRTPAALLEKAGGARAVVIDLNAETGDMLALVRELKADAAGPRVLGFLSHVQTELAQAARQAGADEVLPRSAFSAKLASILTDLSQNA